jgi:NAD(P)-dependent dehydrogenase (short-subunit alcohol dehydrogenase family)
MELAAAARRAEGLAPVEDVFIQGSVSDASTAAAAVAEAVSRFGRLDVLVNNAAVLASSPLLDTSEEEWDHFMQVNAKGNFLCTKAAVGQMMTQERRGADKIRGRVVNISSQHGMVHCPGSLAYGVSKAAVAYMTRQIGVEYIKDGIVVNAVAPGRIMTGRPGSRVSGEGMSEEEEYENQLSRARTPHGAMRLGAPRDVASAVAFLASDDASFIVGENLMVDGGYTAS